MSTYALRKKLVEIARKEIGTVEIGASNTGKRVVEYQRATTLEGTGWPWCAAFVCWCIREWLKDPEVRLALNLKSDREVEAWRPKTASAWGFHEWAQKRGLLSFDDSPDHELHTGDIITFDFSHIGLVENDDGPTVFTIEGNTNGAGSRDGGGVYDKRRPRSLARRFIRLLA